MNLLREENNLNEHKTNSATTTTKLKKPKSKKKENNAPTKITRYRGVRSLFAIRAERRKALGGRKVPLLNIVYTTAFLQFVIVICITTIITLRKDTEFFFYNTSQTFNGIFDFETDASDTALLRTEDLISSLTNKFHIFFNLTKQYSDHYIYPSDILIENKSSHHHHHNLIPSAQLTFKYKDSDSSTYYLNPTNFSILNDENISSIISNCEHIYCNFEIESYSFTNDIRNLWHWSISYNFHYISSSNRMLPYINLSYDRMDSSISWWNKDSIAFMGSVIASFGLCAFSIMALTRFAYKYGFCFFMNLSQLSQLKFRIILPISHLISLLCGMIYLINLSNISDLNDTSWLRLLIALCAWLSWSMCVFSISKRGTEYSAFFETLRISFKPIVILLMSLFPIMMGFILFGSLMFGVPDGNQMFTTPECTAKTLYAVWLGDEVLDTFTAAGIGNVIAEIYMYSWGILFIAMVFNIGLAIVESNFFMTMPQLEAPEDKPGASLRDLIRIKQAKEAKEKAKMESRESKSSIKKSTDEYDSNDSEASSSYDSDYEGMDNEWDLNKCDDSFAIFSNINSSFDFAVADTNGNKKQAAIKLNTVRPKKLYVKENENDIEMDTEIETKLNEREMEKRKEEYIDSFIMHLKHKIIKTIGQQLIDKNVKKLIMKKKCSIDTQKELDMLKDDIIKIYQVYLLNVKTQMTQFVNDK